MPTTYLSRFLLPSLLKRDPYPPLAVPLVMGWAGMRGVVSLAVALSLPTDFPGRDMLLPITLAVVLVSILLQGTTLGPLIRSLHLRGFALKAPSMLDEAAARAHLAQAALAEICSVTIEADGTQRHPRLLEQFAHRAEMATRLAERAEDHFSHRRLHFSLVLAANQAARNDLLGLPVTPAWTMRCSACWKPNSTSRNWAHARRSVTTSRAEPFSSSVRLRRAPAPPGRPRPSAPAVG